MAGIPLPGLPGQSFLTGLDTGSNLFTRIMNPILQREQLAQEKQLSDAQRAQQLRQHLDNLAIQKQSQARLNQLQPLQMALLNAKQQQAMANAQKAQMWSQLFGGQQNSNMQAPLEGQGQVPQVTQQENSSSLQNALQSQTQNTPTSIGQPKEQIINEGDPRRYGLDKLAGMPGVPKVETQIDKDGNLIKIFPSGRITKERVGSSAEEIATNTAMGKYKADAYSNAVDSSQALGDQQANLERLVTVLENQPNASEIIGPMNKNLTQLFGSDEDKAILGDVMAATGNVVLEAAKNIKGAFTGRDQSLINSMKPNASDSYPVFLGKLKGMGELTELSKHRAELYADLLHQGYAPHRALKIAQEQTKIEPITDKYKKIVRSAEIKNSISNGKIPSFESQEEAQQFLQTMNPQEKLKLLKMMGGR